MNGCGGGAGCCADRRRDLPRRHERLRDRGHPGTVAYGTTGTMAYGVLDILHRDPTTGDLTEVGCLSSDGTDGKTGASEACVPTAGLLGGGAVIVSPDGKTVYTGSSASAAILAFHRDPTTGLLTRFGCLRLTPPLDSGCSTANVFGGIDALAVSPDGEGLYAGSGGGGPTPGSTTALSVLTGWAARSGDDDHAATTSAGPTTTSRRRPRAQRRPALAPPRRGCHDDQRGHVIHVHFDDVDASPSVASVFGALAPGQALANPCLATGEVDGACANATATMNLTSLAISPDGHYLYATAVSSQAIDIFARDASGNLAQTGCLLATPPPGPCTPSNSRPTRPTSRSSDGKNAYVAETADVVVADRTAATGQLTNRSCVIEAAPDAGSGSSGIRAAAPTDRPAARGRRCRRRELHLGRWPRHAGGRGRQPRRRQRLRHDGDVGGLVAFARDPARRPERVLLRRHRDYIGRSSSSSCVKAPARRGPRSSSRPTGATCTSSTRATDALYGFGPGRRPGEPERGEPAPGGARATLRIACPRAARSVCAGRVQLATRARARAAVASPARVEGPPAARAARAAAAARRARRRASGSRPGRAAAVYVRIPRAIRAALRARATACGSWPTCCPARAVAGRAPARSSCAEPGARVVVEALADRPVGMEYCRSTWSLERSSLRS